VTPPNPSRGAAANITPETDRRARLLRLADARGIVAGIAIDHRDSFRATLDRLGLSGLADDRLQELKVRLVRTLGAEATAVMLDAELGAQALVAHALPAHAGLIMPLEAQGYEAAGDERLTTLMPEFGPADALARGADACKLLVPYRPDVPATADRQDEVVRATAGACHRLGLPLVVEPVVYPLSTESIERYTAAYPSLVIEAVARVASLGGDLLKLPFPVAAAERSTNGRALEACRDLDRACAGIPWVLLGAGAEIGVFAEQLRVAGAAGASGFLAGRGIWGQALGRDPDEVERRAAGQARADLVRCRSIAAIACRPLAAVV
jgi:tagatose-1,6-bisphosphate aldolase